MQLVLPNVIIRVGNGPHGPFMFSSGSWSEEGSWHSAQAYSLPRDWVGRRVRSAGNPQHYKIEALAVKKHVHNICAQLRLEFARIAKTEVHQRLLSQMHQTNTKSSFLASRPGIAGPPLHIAMTWVDEVSHRAALTSLLAGDWLLARHAGNYFAKSLLP